MLAYELGINKCVSERHIYASRNKMTAGDAAKRLTKMTGSKVLAADVKELYQMHFHEEAEWHHSGFYQGSNGRTMGRTFFLSEEEVQQLADHYTDLIQQRADNIARKEAEEKRQREHIVTGFYWVWDTWYDRSRYGKRRTSKFLHAYEGSELDKPKNFTPCDASLMPAIKAAEGRRYDGWNEPKIEEFKQ